MNCALSEMGLVMKDWFYDESNHVGVDYSQEENADVYDDQMLAFRDYEKEVVAFIDKAKLSDTEEMIAVDIGCGTGAFSLNAARFFKKVYAVDVSEQMLGIASAKAELEGIDKVEFVQSGFLQFQPNEAADVIFTKWAFHHLPDFWKQAGLLNMNKMLNIGGTLFLSDFVFQYEPDVAEHIDGLLSDLSTTYDESFMEETKLHIKEEFSTYDWILQGMIERAGFKIESVKTDDPLATEFLCRKVGSFDKLY